MSPEQNSPGTEIAPPKSRGGMFAVSVLYLLLEVGSFWSHPSPLGTFALIGDLGITTFCVFQFGVRTFDPLRAASTTANMSERTRSRLKQINDFIRPIGGLVIIVVGFLAWTIAGHRFHNWIVFCWPTALLLPNAIDDLLGAPPTRPGDRFSHCIDWSDLKPIRSDHWGRGN